MRPCGHLLTLFLFAAPAAVLAQEPAAPLPATQPQEAVDPVSEIDRLRVENNLLKQAVVQRDQMLLQFRADEISRERNSLTEHFTERGLVVDWSTGAVTKPEAAKPGDTKQ